MVALIVLEAFTAARPSHTSTSRICEWWLKQTEQQNKKVALAQCQLETKDNIFLS